MPNHVIHNLFIRGEKSEEVFEKIKGDDDEHPHIDFNKIIPKPESLDVTSGSISHVAEEIYREHKKTGRPLQELVLERHDEFRPGPNGETLGDYFKNIEEHGYTTWYEWCIAKWGTKWNAYSQSEEDDHISFQTAWSTPFPVMLTLSEMYPDVELIVEYADEDYGSNCGMYRLKAGELVEEDIPEGDEAQKWACNMWGDDYDEWRREIEEG